MYHSVTPRPAPAFRKYSLTPAAFAAQMRWLALAGHRPITLDDLLSARRGQARLPRRAVVITFDDGFQDCADYAVPILQARGFTATFFLVAGLVGGASTWLLAERKMQLALMDWPAARRLEAAGLQTGAHSMRHPHLAELDRAACRAELLDSKLKLEDELGHTIAHLAYPYGSYDEAVRSMAADCGYQTGCSVRIGLSGEADDLLALQRVPVSGRESLLDFLSRLYTSLPLREALRASGAVVQQRRGPKHASTAL
jgi:peptidoglycan/xylan/chitin deacetylase (PgdA/CDA1 family)